MAKNILLMGPKSVIKKKYRGITLFLYRKISFFGDIYAFYRKNRHFGPSKRRKKAKFYTKKHKNRAEKAKNQKKRLTIKQNGTPLIRPRNLTSLAWKSSFFNKKMGKLASQKQLFSTCFGHPKNGALFASFFDVFY
jgi:hypothetical protein